MLLAFIVEWCVFQHIHFLENPMVFFCILLTSIVQFVQSSTTTNEKLFFNSLCKILLYFVISKSFYYSFDFIDGVCAIILDLCRSINNYCTRFDSGSLGSWHWQKWGRLFGQSGPVELIGQLVIEENKQLFLWHEPMM